MRKRCAWQPDPRMAMTHLPTPTPQERLAASRHALVSHMVGDGRETESGRTLQSADVSQDVPFSHEPEGHWSLAKYAAQAWWRHHPAHGALNLVKPALSRYAEDHPFKLLGVAAGLGAVVVVFRPWRVVSLGGLLLTTLKSSQLSGMLLSVLSSPREAPSDAALRASRRRPDLP